MTINQFGVKPGDIYSASWGYDETHVNFYQVVRVTKAKAEVQPIGASHANESGVVPNPSILREWDVLTGIERGAGKSTKLCTVVRGYQGRPSIVLKGGRYWAYQWDGKPEYETPFGLGR